MPQRILIIDDDRVHADTIVGVLEGMCFLVEARYTGEAALARVQERRFDLVITDLVMRGTDGMDVLRAVKNAHPDTEVILVTGYGSTKQAVEAMQQGAYTFLEKPLDLDELRAKVARALEKSALVARQADLEKRLDRRYGLEAIVGDSPGIQRVLGLIQQIGPSNASVLITGENGTGKELVAQALHQLSPRRAERFVPLNCAAIHETLLESELFGHAQGAYTDARDDQEGKFEYAHKGTLFLDEIGDLAPGLQPKFLRVLEDGMVTRLGEHQGRRVDVRVLTATNQDLDDLMKQGRFRRDLFFRLAVVRIDLPPLRARKSDLPVLVEHFLRQARETSGGAPRHVEPEVMRCFSAYDWPGNVRELRNVIQGMALLARGPSLGVELLPAPLAEPPAAAGLGLEPFIGRALDDLERLHIEQTLAYVAGNREQAARMLGISERTLYRKIDRYQFGKKPAPPGAPGDGGVDHP